MRILVRAPSNIALVKYMGKQDHRANLSANPSLSLTLSHLCTWAEVTVLPGKAHDAWRAEPLSSELPLEEGTQRPEPPILSEAGVERILRHAARVRARLSEIAPRFGIELRKDVSLLFRTANTFPMSSGIASSASSFAAITLASAAALCKDARAFMAMQERDPDLNRELSRISREGSGSSCRSFDGPWVLWDTESAAGIRTRMPEMADLVLLFGTAVKEVPSTSAHRLIESSPLWEGRSSRAEARAADLEAALGEGRIADVSKIAWAETWEMHSLFHTCAEPFTYWLPESVHALRFLAKKNRDEIAHGRAPAIVTMDAGPNVHVLVPKVDSGRWLKELSREFPATHILHDEQGTGARVARVED